VRTTASRARLNAGTEVTRVRRRDIRFHKSPRWKQSPHDPVKFPISDLRFAIDPEIGIRQSAFGNTEV
jgi:hypothetical protein